MVPRRGLEPPRSYPLVPETSACTNSATWASQERASIAATASLISVVPLHAIGNPLPQTQPRPIRQHPAGPAIDVELTHRLAQARHAFALLARRHRQGLVQRVGALLHVVRVDDQRH